MRHQTAPGTAAVGNRSVAWAPCQHTPATTRGGGAAHARRAASLTARANKRERRQSTKPHGPAESTPHTARGRPVPGGRGRTRLRGRLLPRRTRRDGARHATAPRRAERDHALTAACGGGRPRRHSPLAAGRISTVTHLDARRWPRIGRQGGGRGRETLTGGPPRGRRVERGGTQRPATSAGGRRRNRIAPTGPCGQVSA